MPVKLKLILPHAVMLAFAAWLYWVSLRIEVDTGGRIGPAVWPKAIIVIMALLCAFEIARRLLAGAAFMPRGLVTSKPPGKAAPGGAAKDMSGPIASHPWKLAGGVALVVGYVLVVPLVGFVITTAVFLAVFPWVGGLRRPVLAAVLGVAGSFLLVVVFMRVAYISLPLGEGPFKALSIALIGLLGVS